VGQIFPVPGANLGIEIHKYTQLQSQVLIEDNSPPSLTKEDQEALTLILSQTHLSSDFTSTQRIRLQHLLGNNLRAFSLGLTNLGKTTVLAHDIITTGDPVKQYAHRESRKDREVVQIEVKCMLDAGVASPSYSPWALPVVLVEKKDASTRFCVDYRRLNALTKKDNYPLPRIDDTLDQLESATIFSSLDLASGFWQVPLTEMPKKRWPLSVERNFLNSTQCCSACAMPPARFNA
jgi:hypothetical protein